MAESQQRPRTVKANDTAAQEAAAEQAHSELPPPGYQREEEIKRREDGLQQEIERQASKIIMGTLDENAVKLRNEIASRTRFLTVSNADPNYKYAWISKNNHLQHKQRFENQGWQTVQGDDPEAIELKGVGGVASGAGAPDTTRQLGDVILMKIPRDRYVMLEAEKHARTIQLHQSSAADLLSIAERYRRYVNVRPYEMDGGLQGPEIQPRAFTGNPLVRKAAMEKLDRHMRAGTIPGMNVQDRR